MMQKIILSLLSLRKYDSIRTMRFTLAFFVFYFLHAPLEAQVQHRSIELGAYGGKILKIYNNFPERDMHSAVAITLSHWKPSLENNVFGRPESGLCLTLHRFGNDSILGYGMGVQYEMAFEQRLSNRLFLTQRIRPGLIYNTKPFDYIDNTKNIVTGANLAALVGVSIGLKYALSDRMSAKLDFSLWHSSNAHTRLPNVGMNSPLAAVSLQYKFYQNPDTITLPKCHRWKPNWSFIGFASYGVNQAGGTTRPVNGPSMTKWLGSAGVSYRFRTIHRLSLTVEAYHDNTYKLWNETMEWTESGDFAQASAIMLLAGHEFIYRRWGMLINAGVNLYNPSLHRIVTQVESESTINTVKRYVPGRIGVRYYFLQRGDRYDAFAQAAVKSNLGQADFFELGLGFNFSRLKN
jgi:hypothetical protein